MTNAAPHLSPALEPARIAMAYRRDGRVHIPGILTAESAQRMHDCLMRETQFRLVTRDGDGYVRLTPDAVLTSEQEARALYQAYDRARGGFNYFYENHPLSLGGEAYSDPSHYLAVITAFLNGAAFLDFARKVTGSSEIRLVEAQATRYRKGHFLNLHDDARDAHGRIAAYVLNMTPRWRSDWGGALLYLDRPDHIAEGYLPAFNALNIFAVPQLHLVSMVSPFAGADRYSITGWFRSR
jgi:SM-20-related protein